MTGIFRYVVVFAIAAASVGVWLYRYGASDQQVNAMKPVPAAKGRTTAITPARSGAFESIEVRTSEAAKEEATAESGRSNISQADQSESAPPSATWEQHSDSHSEAAPPEMDGLSVPEGAPFPVAKLIENECANDEDLYWDCTSVRWALERIEEERRDTQWAPSMESRIRAVVGDIHGVKLRALACRATVCVVETDGELLLPNVWNPLTADLLGAGYVRAYDRTGLSEGTFRVEVWAFKRRR